MNHRTSQSASAVIGHPAGENASLLKAIGVWHLTGYFEFLDELRESGETNMFGAAPYLMREYPGMAREEASAVLFAWHKTFSHTLPPEDRAANAIDAE